MHILFSDYVLGSSITLAGNVTTINIPKPI